MRKLISLLALCLAIVSCTNEEFDIDNQPTEVKSRVITFTLGEFSQQAMTRASVSEIKMTDLWVFDYIGDELKQTIHQTNEEAGFGSISATLDYGSHTLYFVTSRGVSPTVNTDAHKIVWEKPSDTFIATASMTVSATSGSSLPISLKRAATRLSISILDEVPANAASVEITPTEWYYGMDYITGLGTDLVANQTRIVNIPTDYLGTSGRLTVSVFGFVPSEELQTNVSCALKASDTSVLGSVNLENVSLKKNITSSYSGYIIGDNTKTFTLTVDDSWGTEDTHTW